MAHRTPPGSPVPQPPFLPTPSFSPCAPPWHHRAGRALEVHSPGDCPRRERLAQRTECGLKRRRLQVPLHLVVCQSQGRCGPPRPSTGACILSQPRLPLPLPPSLLAALTSSPTDLPSLSHLFPPALPHVLQPCGHTCLLTFPRATCPMGEPPLHAHTERPGATARALAPALASTLCPL